MYARSTITNAKILFIFISSLASLAIFIFSTKGAVLLSARWYGLIIGILLMLFAIPLHIRGKKQSFFYIYSFVVNLVGCGFSASAFYLTAGFSSLELIPLLLGTVPALALLSLLYFFLHFAPLRKRLPLSLAALLTFSLSIVFLFRLPSAETLFHYIFFSAGAFCLLISLFSIFAFSISVNQEENSVLKNVSFCSFGAFLALTFLVLTIFSEGETLSGLDFGGGGGRRRLGK